MRLIVRNDYHALNAKRFVLNDSNQNVWIPNQYLEPDGTINSNFNIDFVFLKSKKKFQLAGILGLYKQFSRPNY